MSDLLPRVLKAWPAMTLLVLAAVFSLMLFFSRKAPLIASLDPPMAAPGETVTVTGDYFGRTAREGTLTLSGEIPPPSLIHSWSDQKIVFDVPEDAVSGLVTISNTQGTSPGVLFTNTESIPTVLKTASPPGAPLIAAAFPPRPVSGQTVTLTGRGFGSGADGVVVRLEIENGPTLEIGPDDSSLWTDRSVAFVLPAGVGAGAFARVATPSGVSIPYALESASPVVFADPRTITVEFHAHVSASRPVVVWGPVPQRSTGTKWTADGPTTAQWGNGQHDLRYKLTLTTWARTPGAAVAASPAPDTDASLWSVWKTAAAALKTLTATWGLETTDPVIRLQRIQTGLAGFRRAVGAHETPSLTGDPVALLTSKGLNSFETASLAAYLASPGIPARLVSGLWLSPDGVVLARTWTDVWLPGGWLPWDPVDGNPGTLDNRHFAFETSPAAPERRLPRSATWGRPAPATLGDATGEVASASSSADPEPVVRWEFTRAEK